MRFKDNQFVLIPQPVKMFSFKALVFVAIIAVTAGKVVDIHTNEIDGSGDVGFDNAYKKIMELADTIVDEIKKDPKAQQANIVFSIYPLIKRSFDPKCMSDNQKLHHFDAKYIELANKLDHLTDSEKIEIAFIHLSTAVRCAKKIKPINEFLFDFVMSFGHLVRAFKDEPELADIKKYLRCANNYVVTKKFWDNVKYPIDYEFINDEEKTECEALKTMLHDAINDTGDLPEEIGHFVSDCLKKSTQDSIDYAVKFLLLLQVDLTPEQRDHEFDSFFNGNIKMFDDQVSCAYELIKKIDETKVAMFKDVVQDKVSSLNLPF